jgi:hypothetical protein
MFCYVLLPWLPLGFPQDIRVMGNMVRLCSDHSTTPSQKCNLPVSIRPQYALEWDDRSCDVQQCAEHAWASGEEAGSLDCELEHAAHSLLVACALEVPNA